MLLLMFDRVMNKLEEYIYAALGYLWRTWTSLYEPIGNILCSLLFSLCVPENKDDGRHLWLGSTQACAT